MNNEDECLIGFVDDKTFKRIKELEKNNPMPSVSNDHIVDMNSNKNVNTENINDMINKCSGFFETLKGHYGRYGKLSEKDLLILRKTSEEIRIAFEVVETGTGIPISNGSEYEKTKEFLLKCKAAYPNSTFVDSVIGQFSRNGYITEKQRASLQNTLDDAINKTTKTNRKVIDIESEEYKTTKEFLGKCLAAYPGSDFVKSINEQFERNGHITEKQRTALTGSLNDAMKKADILKKALVM